MTCSHTNPGQQIKSSFLCAVERFEELHGHQSAGSPSAARYCIFKRRNYSIPIVSDLGIAVRNQVRTLYQVSYARERRKGRDEQNQQRSIPVQYEGCFLMTLFP